MLLLFQSIRKISSWMLKTPRIILQEKFLPAAHEDLLAAFQVEVQFWNSTLSFDHHHYHHNYHQHFIWSSSQALDVDNSGHIDKELLTQIFTEEGEAFSEVENLIFCFSMKNLSIFPPRKRCKSFATLLLILSPSPSTIRSLYTSSQWMIISEQCLINKVPKRANHIYTGEGAKKCYKH